MRDPVFLVHEKPCTHFHCTALHPKCLTSARAIETAFVDRPQCSLWLAKRADLLLRVLLPLAPKRSAHRLLLLDGANTAGREALRRLFTTVVARDTDARFLPDEELAHALAAENRAGLFIGAAADVRSGALVLYRGDLTTLVVPLTMFRTRRGGPRPDPERLEIVDCGQTLRLGDYEASADSILYELDPGYRRRAKARRLERDDSFGGSLKRLRLQKGLRRSDFGTLSAKQIARLERGESRRPHAATLTTLAAKLGVPVEALGTF